MKFMDILLLEVIHLCLWEYLDLLFQFLLLGLYQRDGWYQVGGLVGWSQLIHVACLENPRYYDFIGSLTIIQLLQFIFSVCMFHSSYMGIIKLKTCALLEDNAVT